MNIEKRDFTWMCGKSTGHGMQWFELARQPDFKTTEEALAWFQCPATDRLHGFESDFEPSEYILVPKPFILRKTWVLS